jgi:ATP-binding cassette, subfamily B, bacterial MsbA
MKLYIRLLKYIKGQLPNIIAAIVCIILLAACNIAMIPLANMLTSAIANKDFHSLNIIAFGVISVYFFKGILSYAQVFLMAFAGQRIIIDLRIDLYKHIQTLSFDFFSKWRVGDIMSRIVGDTGSLQNAMMLSVTEILPNILTLIGAVIYILSINFRLALMTLLVAPVLVLTISRFSIKIREIARLTQRKAADISSILAEKVAGIKVVKSFTTEHHEIKKFSDEVEKSFWLTMREVQVDATQKPLLELIQAVAITLVVWYGAYEVLAGTLTVNNLIAFFVGVGLIATPIATLGKITIAIQRSMSSAERIFEVLDTQPSIADLPNAVEMPEIKGNVEFNNVEFHYDKATPILKGLNLKTRPGEIVAIVGRSGAGKSTFVNLIPRFYDAVSGSVVIDGIDVKKAKLFSLRRQIGIVHQDTILFSGSIKENIAYGNFDATDAQVIAAAKAANIHDFIMTLPEKYSTLVGERGVLLSGGEKQRVSIARAILRDPRILILDEATSSLDTESERLVQDALEHLIKGRTTFIIAHRLSTVQVANRILVFDKGHIIEEGSHRELMNKGGTYKMLYDMQFRDDDDPNEKEDPYAVE